MHGPTHVSPRRLEALRALAERGATEGEREAARVALEAALRDRPIEPAPPPARAQPKRTRPRASAACRWIKLGHTWAISGPKAVLKMGRVKVQAHNKRPREVEVHNVRRVDDQWIADEVPAPASRPPPPTPPPFGAGTRPGPVRHGKRPPPPYRRPDLLPEHFMQCWRLEDMLEELAGADALAAVQAAMQPRDLDETQRRARLTAEIWHHQKQPDDPRTKRRP